MAVVKLISIVPDPDRREELLSLLDTVKRASEQEPGTEVWTLHTSRSDQSRLYLYERYRDEEAVEAHDELPELRELLSRIGDLVAETPSVEILDVLR
jgi:quinol monooxygenase YgiN